MLTEYCQNILKIELSKTDYNNKTSDQAWTWLMEDTVPNIIKIPNGKRLTPLIVAKLLGPVKAEAMAAALKSSFPTIGQYLLETGVDPLNEDTIIFVTNLVTNNIITSDDAINLSNIAYDEIQPPTYRQFDRRFFPQDWPHVASNGTIGIDTDPAIHGFPNSIERSDFDAAWAAAGRQ